MDLEDPDLKEWLRELRLERIEIKDVLPIFGTGSGHQDAELLFETSNGDLLGYSLFEKSPSANAILIGSTGSGKSTLGRLKQEIEPAVAVVAFQN